MIRYLSVVLLAAAAPSPALAQSDLPHQAPALPPDPLPVTDGSPFVVYPVRDGVFMISGPAANVAVMVGREGVLLVDSGPLADAPGLLREVRRLSPKPVLYILLTNGDVDHVGGNTIMPGLTDDLVVANERPEIVDGFGAVPTLAHEGVMNALIEDGATEGLPTLTFFVQHKDIYFNGQPVSLIHAPGHTAGDSMIMFRRADVIAAGDIYTPDRYPQIDTARGGSITAYLDSLNQLIGLTIPEFNQQGGTFVIPGHGRLSDEGDIQHYRDMVTFIRDRVAAQIERGHTLEQTIAARPSYDYDALYGADAGEEFVRQVYLSLMAEAGQ